MLNVLVTMRFEEAQLDPLRAVSPELRVTRDDPETADYSRTDILYAGTPPRDLSRAPHLKWVQLHMAGVNALYDHPLYTESAIPLRCSELFAENLRRYLDGAPLLNLVDRAKGY